MGYLSDIILFTLAADLGLGVAVYLVNRQRAANQQYLLFSFIIAVWLVSIGNAMTSTTEAGASLLIRLSHVTAGLIITGFNLLRQAILRPNHRILNILHQGRFWLLSNLLCLLICASPTFLVSVTMPSAGDLAIPEPGFGPGFILFALYFVAASTLTVYLFIRDMRRLQGMQRAEVQFVMLAGVTGLVLGCLLAVILPLTLGSSQITQYTPLATVVANTIIAYGIATTRIMEVAQLLQRTVMAASALLLVALVYVSSFLFLTEVVPNGLLSGRATAGVVSAMLAAGCMIPAQRLVTRAASYILAKSPLVDENQSMQQANQLLQSIATLDDLLKDFATLIAQAVDANHIRIFLNDGGRYRCTYTSLPEQQPPALDSKNDLVLNLNHSTAPLSLDDIRRLHRQGTEARAGESMQILDASLALGIKSKEHLEGFILLGPRTSGRIYGSPEQARLQFLANQFAVAVENARLYTQVQNSKIYNDILVDNMVSGVIAVNADHEVTVFNREAQRITRRTSSKVLYQPMSHLPSTLADLLKETLLRSERTRDLEIVLRHDNNDELPLRVGTSVFHSHTGEVLGALLVINDLSQLKKLEQQVRRTDRLASIGTLAAGMAHEIKNPLVALKTFTQLLPERYEDPEFRSTFTSLIGSEVTRIDSLVNRMLDFARPAKPDLAPMHLHEQIQSIARLVGQQAKSCGVDIDLNLAAKQDLIMADTNLLHQAILNLALNGLDAMTEGGRLVLATRNLLLRYESRSVPAIRLSIRDTGQGIAPDLLPQIFDPFFTTKDSGTGLGLSVSHGIVTDHQGVLDVESDVGQGTTFHMTLQLNPENPA